MDQKNVENISKESIPHTGDTSKDSQTQTEDTAPTPERALNKSSSQNLENLEKSLQNPSNALVGGNNSAGRYLLSVAKELNGGELTSQTSNIISSFISNSVMGYTSVLPLICRGEQCSFLSACNPPGTIVLTANRGYRNIEDLDIEKDKIVSVRGDKKEGAFYLKGRKFTLDTKDFSGRLIGIKVGQFGYECTPDHICIAKWTEKALSLFAVYLMRRGDLFRIGKCQLFQIDPKEKSDVALFGPGNRGKDEYADEMWVLGVYGRSTEALLAEEEFSVKYGIPKNLFIKRDTKYNGLYANITHTQLLEHHKKHQKPIEFYASLLSSLGLSIHFPFWKTNDTNVCGGIQKKFEIRACNLIPKYMSMGIIDRAWNHTDTLEWLPIDIEYREYTGPVYSLGVEKDETYLANHVYTHNCPLHQANSPLPIGKACQPPDTKILTNKGLVKIEDLNNKKHKVIGYSNGKITKERGFTLHSRHYPENILEIRTRGNKNHRVTLDHISIIKWSEKAVGATAVYLMQKGQDFRVGYSLIFPLSRNFSNPYGLVRAVNDDRGDKLWILGVYEDKLDALLSKEHHSLSLGISKTSFTVRSHKGEREQEVMQKEVDTHFAKLRKTESEYRDMLSGLGLEYDYPLFHRSGRARIPDTLISFKDMEVRARNLIPKYMEVPTEDSGAIKWEEIKEVNRTVYDDIVYSLEVEEDHAYVADGIVTHNCPVESSLATLWVTKHLKALGIQDISDPENSFDMDLLYELAGQELIRWRCGVHLSDDASLVSREQVSATLQGEPIFADVINPVLTVMERAGKSIAKIREALVATREAQIKAGQDNRDASLRASELRAKTAEILEKKREYLNRLQEKKEVVLDADFTIKPLEQPKL